MERRAEIVVVGGGPAGAAAATTLARLGRKVLVLDRAIFPRDKLCGDFIHPLGVAALDRLGVKRDSWPLARVLQGMIVVSPAGREVRAPFSAGVGLSISRAVLDGVLLRAAQESGAIVETGRPVREVYRRDGGWRIVTGEGEISARVLVGADGRNSVVAQAAGLRAHAAKRGRYALGFRVRGLEASEGYAEMHLSRGAYCGVSALPGGEANVTAVFPKVTFARHRHLIARDPAAAARELLRPFPSVRARLAPAEVMGMRAIGPLAPSGGAVVGDAVVLVGDAASFTDPLTGQGVSLALTGAHEAGGVIEAALRDGDVGAARLAPYARWHRRRLAALRHFLRVVDWIALSTPLVEPLARAWQRHPAMATRFLSVIGNGDPVGRVLAPAYLSRLALACISRA